MFDVNFNKNLGILKKSMNVANIRSQVIADNIANSEVPNFKRSSIAFESMLKSSLDSEKKASFKAKLTNDKHIDFNFKVDYNKVMPKRIIDYNSIGKNNGNNVDIEQEANDYISNQLSYRLLADMTNNMFKKIDLVLK